MYIITLVKIMRIRYKKWARPELEASKFYIDNPEEWKGKWKEFFEKMDYIKLQVSEKLLGGGVSYMFLKIKPFDWNSK